MSLDFNKIEEEILDFWEKNNIFDKSLEQNKDLPRFSFYDGPPFATGLPHYGHLLAGTIKDVVTRFAHQSGHYVERRFGWDCHGLPVEYEIDQALGIKGPEDVEKMGIKAYNAECRKIVMRYSSEWVKIVKRMGRWIDFENDYKTMYPQFMESVWWVFKQLHIKNLVYRGYKVMPYSTACSTPLSNFESNQNYKEVSDPSVLVMFQVLIEEKPSNKYFLVWTTTPWTLPSNLALCCNADLDYVEIQDIKTEVIYICLESRTEFVFKKNFQNTHKILKKFKGIELKGMRYVPLFDYFKNDFLDSGFKVVTDNYVSAESGTGVVHQAPYFGEDDQRVCLAYNIIHKDGPTVCPIDAKGRFIEPVEDFLGQYIKDADKAIIKNLKQRNLMFRDATVNHSYPFCWRSDTPLIYRAVPSWFIRVEQMRSDLLKQNAETHWVPEFIKEGRFANWLKDARDWSVSRNRYWGTPIPLWVSDDLEEVVCIGSIEELETLSGVKITDLHRENVDQITIPSKQGKGQLRRVSEVFDCWFESGSMPYAQQHYPFENSDKFMSSFPADFIAEGVDQTRGWFYTLLVISTALFNKPPYKNLIINGLVLASDGQKMSKRKKNYPDPMDIVGKFGADALRLYLITSPAVRAEGLKFKEDGVKDILKEVIIPLCNSCRFLVQSIQVFEKEHGQSFKPNDSSISRENIMDQWIVSFTQSLINFVRIEMSKYRLYTVVPRLVKYVDHLTNWYIRMNRLRLKGREGKVDCLAALSTLYYVITQISTLMAPFTPFISEYLYKDLVKLTSCDNEAARESIHLLEIPKETTQGIDGGVEQRVSSLQRVIDLGRVIRDRKTLPLKMPLANVVVISSDKSLLRDVEEMAGYIELELNVETVITTDDKEKYGVKIKAQPDIKLLGARLRGESKNVIELIKQMSELDLQEYQKSPANFKLGHHNLEEGEIKLIFTFESDSDKVKAGDEQLQDQPYEANSDGDMIVLLHTVPNQELADRGFVREFVNRIQKLRKKAGLVPTDSILVQYSILGEMKPETRQIVEILAKEEENVVQTIKCSKLECQPPEAKFESKVDSAWEEVNNIRDSDIRIRITKL